MPNFQRDPSYYKPPRARAEYFFPSFRLGEVPWSPRTLLRFGRVLPKLSSTTSSCSHLTSYHRPPSRIPCGYCRQTHNTMSVFSLIKPLAYLSLPVVVLHSLSKSSPIARYYVRLGLYLSTIGACSVWGAIVAVTLSVVGDRFNSNWVVARSFYAITSRLFGIKVVVEGEEYLDTRPSILVGNHQSMLDLIYIGRCASSPTTIAIRSSFGIFAESSLNAHR